MNQTLVDKLESGNPQCHTDMTIVRTVPKTIEDEVGEDKTEKKSYSKDKGTIPAPEMPYILVGSIGATLDVYTGLYTINNDMGPFHWTLLLIGTSLILYGLYMTNKIEKQTKKY